MSDRKPLSSVVQRFAEAMQDKLDKNVNKGGWDREPLWWLRRRLSAEAEELRQAIHRKADPLVVRQEAADVANFAMMVADVYAQRRTRR